jgi:hypothetical protein
MMKKFYIFLAAVSLMAISSPCFSSYIIEFVNGNQVWVNQYWEEGDNIKCDLYGGIVSFHKDTIKTIRLSDKPYTYETSSTKNKEEKKPEIQKDETADEASTEQIPEETVKAEPPPPLTEPEKIALIKEKEALSDRFREAASEYKEAQKNKDEAGIKAASEKFVTLREQEANLIKRVKERNNGSLPEWWDSEE